MTQIQLFITEFEYYMITHIQHNRCIRLFLGGPRPCQPKIRKPAKTQRDMTIINIIRIMIATFLEPEGDYSPRNLEIR